MPSPLCAAPLADGPRRARRSRRLARALAVAALWAGIAAAWAQPATPAPRTLQPLAPATVAGALARPVGAAMPSPRTSGRLDLQGKRFYIAEYQLLVEVGGEAPAPAVDGRVLGRRVGAQGARLAFAAQPDIGALQALTDRAWADLQARLAAAGVQPEDIDRLLGSAGAVYEASAPASTPGQPVLVESAGNDAQHRYLVLAPTGMGIVPRLPAGLNPGNLAARVAFATQGIEGLSLAIAVNLGGLDPAGERRSSFAGGGPALSPWMELVPAPQSALVQAHAQLAQVTLAEALVLAPEFGRLVPAPTDAAGMAGAGGGAADPLQALLALGRRLGVAPGEAPRVDARLELDGPATARTLLYAVAAANQAIADALKAARAAR
ncbi:hypothetical protein AACH10_14660 [Ideonella sp. DXS22W]|uniref:DUF3313 domain-containing protein n=1 Tax=Pseudaquabacterium inlustre TaxID=2984192 RepID=A0ABU9CI14_9BURK